MVRVPYIFSSQFLIRVDAEPPAASGPTSGPIIPDLATHTSGGSGPLLPSTLSGELSGVSFSYLFWGGSGRGG
jgi:hypothetical protein